MSRDHRKLRVFALAEDLILEVYRMTAEFPAAERFGLQLQLRRAAVSAATNIVEGSARRTTREYLSFLNIATGSAAEAHYLLQVCVRLGVLRAEPCASVLDRYAELIKRLKNLVNSLDRQLEGAMKQPIT